jgi:hypothetical protein
MGLRIFWCSLFLSNIARHIYEYDEVHEFAYVERVLHIQSV